MFCAPLLFSGDRLTVGGSWEDYVRVKDPLNVLDVCTICLGRLDEISKLEAFSCVVDRQLKHYVVCTIHDYTKPDICQYSEKIQNTLHHHSYIIQILQHLNKHIQ